MNCINALFCFYREELGGLGVVDLGLVFAQEGQLQVAVRHQLRLLGQVKRENNNAKGTRKAFDRSRRKECEYFI